MAESDEALERPGAPPRIDDVPYTQEQLLDWYRQMRLIRRVEEQAAKAYMQKKILGFCHLYIGMEAVAVGATAALRSGDTIVSAYREHGQAMARGVTPRQVMAELFGKRTGINQGIGGSMHMGSAEHNFFGGYGIVGGHIPLAVGAAFASKYRGDDDVALVYFGDGAAQQGAFYEALELAQLWALPVIFLCENNYYAMGTSLERQSYLTDMSRRGDGVGMRRWQFGGFDVLDVYRNITRAAEHARSGKGPVIVEAVTYRYRGHSMSDPAKYRKDGELDEFRAKDCIDSAHERLVEEFGVSEDDLAQIKTDVNVEAKDAYDFAESSPEADTSRLYDFTYAPTEA
ncbi:MAG: pyruvate dehydrogenase E1 component alpha subunit [Myxococcota bacterium]|jgi:pyruvate dehydrogenase E1 component alpha subunit